MILHIEFSIGHEPIETTISILKEQQKVHLPSLILVIRHFMFLVFSRECQKINRNKFNYTGFSLFENVVNGKMTVRIIKFFLLHPHVNISM